MNSGGALIATFESGLNPDKKDFNLSCLGVSKAGDGPKDTEGAMAIGKIFSRNNFTEYLVPKGKLSHSLRETEYAMYNKGLPISSNAEVLLFNTTSHFDRTMPDDFCSHRQTPSSGASGELHWTWPVPDSALYPARSERSPGLFPDRPDNDMKAP